jgi:hypothetical protein
MHNLHTLRTNSHHPPHRRCCFVHRRPSSLSLTDRLATPSSSCLERSLGAKVSRVARAYFCLIDEIRGFAPLARHCFQRFEGPQRDHFITDLREALPINGIRCGRCARVCTDCLNKDQIHHSSFLHISFVLTRTPSIASQAQVRHLPTRDQPHIAPIIHILSRPEPFPSDSAHACSDDGFAQD